jgi:hypothetical protein
MDMLVVTDVIVLQKTHKPLILLIPQKDLLYLCLGLQVI